VIRALILTVLLGGSLHAQLMSGMNYIFNLDNGARVLYTTFSQENQAIKNTDTSRMYGTAVASGNVIRRTMTDGNNQTWLGFELHIDRLPGDPIRFRLSMTPIGGVSFFGESAPAREINNGDRILLDVLEEPGTGRKIYDSFQVGISVDMQLLPLPRNLPGIPAAGATIQLQQPELKQSAPTAMISHGRSDGTVKAATVSLLVPGKGRFLFSTQPARGFRMEAIGERKHLAFVSGNNYYDVQCTAPVLELAGSWYLWVKYEADGASSKNNNVPELKLQ
jgi:hypothetical protein